MPPHRRYISPVLPTSARRLARALRALLVALVVAPLPAQRLLPPGTAAFELPIASPRASGFVGRIVAVSRGESSFGPGTEADVVLAENLPVLRLGGEQRPWTVDFGVGTQARFSLTDPKSSLISNDWTVGFDVSGQIGRAGVAAQIYHESSHLGDEYVDRFGTRRLDWTREVLMGWVGIPAGQATLRIALGSVLVDQLGLARTLAAVAVDYRGRDGYVGRTPARLVAGIFTEAAAATRWRLSTSFRIAVELGPQGGNRLALGLVAHDGLSTQRQFYQNESRYVGTEIRFDL